jgi:hypothetical protein
MQYLDKKYQKRIEREEFYAAMVSATTANYSMCHPKDPLKPLDFMPSHRDKRPEEHQEADDDLLAQKIHSMLAPRSVPTKKE